MGVDAKKEPIWDTAGRERSLVEIGDSHKDAWTGNEWENAEVRFLFVSRFQTIKKKLLKHKFNLSKSLKFNLSACSLNQIFHFHRCQSFSFHWQSSPRRWSPWHTVSCSTRWSLSLLFGFLPDLREIQCSNVLPGVHPRHVVQAGLSVSKTHNSYLIKTPRTLYLIGYSMDKTNFNNFGIYL